MLPETVMIWLYRYKIPQGYIILLPTEKHKTETYTLSISLRERKRGGGKQKEREIEIRSEYSDRLKVPSKSLANLNMSNFIVKFLELLSCTLY